MKKDYYLHLWAECETIRLINVFRLAQRSARNELLQDQVFCSSRSFVCLLYRHISNVAYVVYDPVDWFLVA